MKVFVLVEGPSEKELMERWAPRAFPGHQFMLRPHQGKGELPKRKPDPRRRGLLDQLPATLKAYADSCQDDEAVLVLVDADDDDCLALKQSLLELAKEVCPHLRVAFRIAVEETEAFYFGDLRGIRAAFPDADIDRARSFSPDARVGTAEEFAAVVHDDTLRKVDWAEKIGMKLTTKPQESRSPSFKALHAGIEKLIANSPKPKKQRGKHWKARYSSKPKRR